MTPILSGVLHLRPVAGSGEAAALRLTPGLPEAETAGAALPAVRQGEALEATLVFEPGPFAASLVQRPVGVVIAAEEDVILKQDVVPAVAGGLVTAGPVVLKQDVFDDRAGVVRLSVTVENSHGVAVTLAAERFTLKLADTETGRRLEAMLQRVLSFAPKLLPEADEAAVRPRTTAAFWDLVERIAAACTELHRYFEKSARFRLQQGERMTALSRVTSVTHRTLEFIATHPEELQPTDLACGIDFGGRRWLPGRTVDETHQKTYDIYENRCITGFLQTVWTAAHRVVKSLDALVNFDDAALFKTTVGPVRDRAQKELLPQIQSLAAAYARFFGLEETAPLSGLPEPSAIFISSAPYRRLYELMQEWFASELPNLSDVRCLLDISKSSRIYEHYVLTLLVEALGEPQSRRRLVYPGAPARLQQSTVCNEYVFRRNDAEVTLFYEPVVPSGRQAETVTGLVRTMTFDFSQQGVARKDPAASYWTPDYVLRVKDSRGVRCWIADAKYQTWPTFLANYAETTLAKYLLATATKDPAERLAGFIAFCGKDYGAGAGRRRLRDVDSVERREPAAEVMTLCGEGGDEVKQLAAWLAEIGAGND